MKKNEKIYVGIDFSKEKFDACCLDGAGGVHHAVFQNCKKDFRKLIAWVKKCCGLGATLDPSETLFCGEHTGMCSLALSEWLVEQGYRIWLQNPLAIKNSNGISRGKSDKADSQMIANYAMEKYKPGETRLFSPDSEAVKELASLYSCRLDVVKMRVALGNRISSGSYGSSPCVIKLMKKTFKELKEREKALEKEMVKLMEESKELRNNYAILRSFKGIGALTAAMLLVYTSNFMRFDNPRSFACQCGIAPFGKDSGVSIHIGPHVSQYAQHHPKAALVLAAKCAMRFNPVIKTYAESLTERGKHHGIVINNVKNKIIHILFKMIKTQEKWDSEYQDKHSAAAKSDDAEQINSTKATAAPTRHADSMPGASFSSQSADVATVATQSDNAGQESKKDFGATKSFCNFVPQPDEETGSAEEQPASNMAAARLKTGKPGPSTSEGFSSLQEAHSAKKTYEALRRSANPA